MYSCPHGQLIPVLEFSPFDLCGTKNQHHSRVRLTKWLSFQLLHFIEFSRPHHMNKHINTVNDCNCIILKKIGLYDWGRPDTWHIQFLSCDKSCYVRLTRVIPSRFHNSIVYKSDNRFRSLKCFYKLLCLQYNAALLPILLILWWNSSWVYALHKLFRYVWFMILTLNGMFMPVWGTAFDTLFWY